MTDRIKKRRSPRLWFLVLVMVSLTACSGRPQEVVLRSSSDPGAQPHLQICSIQKGTRVQLEMRDGRQLNGYFIPMGHDSLRIRVIHATGHLTQPVLETFAWRDVVTMDVKEPGSGYLVLGATLGLVTVAFLVSLAIASAMGGGLG